MYNSIHISRLALHCHIGVPEEERAMIQRLEVSMTLFTTLDQYRDLKEDLERTVDYAEVCASIRELAGSRPRKLMETLAQEICDFLIETYPLAAVEVELRKFILPETEYVSVRIRRDSVHFEG